MKFDFCIGNPPYQEETKDTSDMPIYNKFMDSAYEIAEKVELITPARFLFDAGKTPKDWNEKMLADPHLKVLYYEQDSSKVFQNTDIKGGVCVSYRDRNQKFGAIGAFSSFPELNSILKKVRKEGFQSLEDVIVLQNRWNLASLYKDHPEYSSKIGSNGNEKRLTTSIFSTLEVFREKGAETDVKVLGLIGNKRCFRYIDQKYIEQSHKSLRKYKVILPKSNGSGAIGEVLSTPLIGEPLIGYTQSFIGIGSFNTLSEAEAALNYVKTKFARTMLGILKITQDNPPDKWKYVPLQNFTSSSDIDWSKTVAEIDRQLYKKYGLSEEEIQFIEKNVKEME